MSVSSDEELDLANVDLPSFTTEERQSIRKAIDHFYKNEFEEASSIFADVLSNRLTDYRISHNLIISGFYQNGLKDVDRFREQFADVLNEANIELNDLKVENISQPVFLYNLALMYFQDRQPWKALELATTLSKHLRLADYSCPLGKRTRLLIMELYITLQNFDLALDKIEMETKRKFRQSMSAGSSTSGMSPCSSISDLSESVLRNEAEQQYDQSVKIKMQEYKTLALLCTRTLNAAKKEYKILGTMTATAFSNEYGRTIVSFLKAYYNYLRGNIRKGLTIISAITIPKTIDSFLETGDNMTMIINNNLGCCHYSLGKPTIAAWYFQKASQESNKPEYKDRKSLPIHCLSFNKKYEIMYNFGVSLLHAKQSQEAFNVLTICQIAFPSNPRLWLRISECCVQLYKSTNENDFMWTEKKRNILRGIENEVPLGKLECLSTDVIDPEKPKPTLRYALHCIETALPLINTESVLRFCRLDVRPSNPITNAVEIYTLRANILCTGAFITLTLGHYAYTVRLCNELIGMIGVPNVFNYLGKVYLSEALFKQGDVTLGLEMFSEKLISNYTLNLTNVTEYEGFSYGCTSFNREGSGEPGTSDTGVTTTPPPVKFSHLGSSLGFKSASEWHPKDELTSRATVVYNRAVALTALNYHQEAAAVIDEWNSRVSFSGHSLPADFIILQIYLNLRLGNMEKSSRLFRQHYCPMATIPQQQLRS